MEKLISRPLPSGQTRYERFLELQRKYAKTEAGKARLKKYRQTEKGKQTNKKCNKKYINSEKGKKVRSQINKRYRERKKECRKQQNTAS